MYTLKRTVDPVHLPLELGRVKQYLRISNDQHDAELAELFIPAAADIVQTETSRQLITATYQLGLREWPTGQRLYLPLGNLQSVTSVVYRDDDDVSQTWDSANYSVNTAHEPGYIQATTWPQDTDGSDKDHPVTITYVCGYGDTADALPRGLHVALLMTVSHLFEMRMPIVTGTIASQLPWAIDRLLAQYRLGDGFWDYGIWQ